MFRKKSGFLNFNGWKNGEKYKKRSRSSSHNSAFAGDMEEIGKICFANIEYEVNQKKTCSSVGSKSAEFPDSFAFQGCNCYELKIEGEEKTCDECKKQRECEIHVRVENPLHGGMYYNRS